MSTIQTLKELAQQVDQLLVKPASMAKIRQLAEDCLAHPELGHVDALQFPTDPENAFNWDTKSIKRERGLAENATLTQEQLAICIAALHDIYCPGVEPVITVDSDVTPLDEHGRATKAWRRFTRWQSVRNRVRSLGDYALHWFERLLSRLQQSLEQPAPLNELGNPLPSSVSCTQILASLPRAARQAYLAFKLAEAKTEKELKDDEAYAYLDEHGIPKDAGELGELTDYELPGLDNWKRNLRTARSGLGEQKYTPRAGRPTGRSIVRGRQVEQQNHGDC